MRFLRILLWTVALVAILAMSYVVAVYFLVNADSVSKRISDEFERNFGYQVSMHAAPQVRVLPTIEIDLPAATIKNKDNQTVLFYRAAHLEVNPIWLVFGQTHLDKLHIDGLATQVVLPNSWTSFIDSIKTDKLALFDDVVIKAVSLNQAELTLIHNDQSISLRNIALSVNEPAPQMHGQITVAAQLESNSDGLLFDAQSTLDLDLDLHRGIIGLENLQLQAQGTRGSTPLDLVLKSSIAKLQAHNAYVNSAELKIDTNDHHDHIAMSVADLLLDNTQLQAPDLRLIFAQGVGNQRFELDVRSPFSIQWAPQILNATHIQGSLLLPDTTSATPLSGQTLIDLINENADIQLFGRLHGAPMSFKGQIQSFVNPKVQGQLTFGRLDVSLLQSLSALQGIEFAQSFEDPSVPGTISSESVTTEPTQETSPMIPQEETAVQAPASEEPTPIEEPIPNVVPQNETTPQIAPVVWIEGNHGRYHMTQAVTSTESKEENALPVLENTPIAKALDFAWLERLEFNGDLIIGELLYQEARLQQVKTPLKIVNGTLTLPKVIGLAYDGQFNGFASINSQGHWNSHFKANNINLSGLLSNVGASGIATGKLDVQANLYGEDFTSESLNGQIGFIAHNATINGIDLGESLRTIEKGLVPNNASGTQTKITKAQGVATLHAGQAEIENLSVTFDNFTLKGQAVVQLKDQTLRGKISGQNHRGLNTLVSLVGSWYQPILEIDATTIMKLNGITPKPTTVDQPKEKKPSSWDRIKSFIKERL